MSHSDVFEQLSKILRPYAKEMTVKTDTDTNLYLEEDKSAAKPQMFGAVQIKKNYTSFHLFPVYCDPSLLDEISPELRKRMQGKSCFNFKKPEDIPVAELTSLVENCYKSL